MPNVIKSGLKEKDRVLELASRDIVSFGQMFLPDDFMKSTPAPYHYELSDMLLNTEKKRCCIILPRGHSKSTLAKTALLYKLYFNKEGKKEFMAWVAEEQSQAIDHIKYIQSHIEFNPALLYYFGDIKGNKWTEKEFTTSKGDRVIGKGTNQRLRGRSEIGLRYTKIILDDFESELNTKTPERRREIKEWVMSTVEPALEESKGNEGEVWLIGTIVHYDSFLQSIYDGFEEAKRDKRKYAWEVIFHKAMKDGAALWPSYFSKTKLKDIRRRFEDMGLVHKFAQEYMNEARDLDSLKFKVDRIQHYSGEYRESNGFGYILTKEDAIPVNVYIGVDLAYEAGAKHDYQAIVVIGVDSDKNYYVIDYYREHSPLYQMPNRILEYCKLYAPVKRASVEVVGAQGVIKDAVRQLSSEDRKMMPGIIRGTRPPNRIKKEDRIESLLCPIVNRKKLFIKKENTELFDEMFQFPKAKHDDLLDGMWYACISSRAPLSRKFNVDNFDEKMEKDELSLPKGKKINWITGLRL
tara:strand:- start:75 stop:1640 length:1566 start_codon:yes stop_codon:yes gene_type:complete